jgi:hypothetical protein
MFMADQINNVIESQKSKLLGGASYFYFASTLTRSFTKAKIPFKFKYETYDDYSREDFSVSGLYDMDTNIKYIMLNFSKYCKNYKIEPKRWEEFKFSISQVCQHETIHELQWQHRDGSIVDKAPLEFRSISSSNDEEKEYLADPDEIDAYGHDIAMEIKFYYPKQDPYDVLNKISSKRKLWSYNYYKKTFKGDDWSHIKSRLLKKTYQWIPHAKV